jgi:exosome complex component RRP4
MTRIVVPGELLSEKQIRARGTYASREGTRAAVMGIFHEEGDKFVPLKGSYIPMIGDKIVGTVVEEKVIGYGIDIFSPYRGLLPSRMTRLRLSPGELVAAEIADVSEVKDVILGRPRSLKGGRVAFISPMKVPRAIGKNNSMVQLIQSSTGCEVDIGRNGAVWVKGQHEQLAIDALMKIDREAHIAGLTDRMQAWLEEQLRGMKSVGDTTATAGTAANI